MDSAIAELSVPLAITVVAIQNAQGIAVLSAAGHRPPVDLVATVSGIGALITKESAISWLLFP